MFGREFEGFCGNAFLFWTVVVLLHESTMRALDYANARKNAKKPCNEGTSPTTETRNTKSWFFLTDDGERDPEIANSEGDPSKEESAAFVSTLDVPIESYKRKCYEEYEILKESLTKICEENIRSHPERWFLHRNQLVQILRMEQESLVLNLEAQIHIRQI